MSECVCVASGQYEGIQPVLEASECRDEPFSPCVGKDADVLPRLHTHHADSLAKVLGVSGDVTVAQPVIVAQDHLGESLSITL